MAATTKPDHNFSPSEHPSVQRSGVDGLGTCELLRKVERMDWETALGEDGAHQEALMETLVRAGPVLGMTDKEPARWALSLASRSSYSSGKRCP